MVQFPWNHFSKSNYNKESDSSFDVKLWQLSSPPPPTSLCPTCEQAIRRPTHPLHWHSRIQTTQMLTRGTLILAPLLTPSKNQSHMFLLSFKPFQIGLSNCPPYSPLGWKRSKRHTNWKGNIKPSLYKDDMIIENPKEST